MSNPRSSRRTSARVATFHVDDEIEISSSLLRSDSLGDRVSGAGPPVLSLQGNADLTEVPDSFAHDESTEFGIQGLENFRMDRRHVIEKDSWAFSLLGKWFKYKDLELEDDLEFKAKHPTNNFRIYCLVHYNGSKRKFLYPSVTYAKRNLYFICYSVDALDDYELVSVASFHPKLSERNKFYQYISGAENSQDNMQLNDNPIVEESAHEEEYCGFMQGVNDTDSISKLSATQMGALLTFVPPARSYILDQYALSRFRKSFLKIIKILNSDVSDQIKDKMSNVMMTLPYMFLQFDGNRADKGQCDKFMEMVMNDQMDLITVGDFKRKTLKKKQTFDKKYDFASRCHKEADKNAQHGDFGKAMESLQKIDAKINLENVS